MPTALSGIAIIYGVLWLVAVWFGNPLFMLIVSGFGVLLLVITALSVDGIDDQDLE